MYGRRRNWLRRGGLRWRFRSPSVNPVVVLKLAVVALVLGVIVALVGFVYISKSLPDPNSVVRKEGYSTQILDREEKEILYQVFESKNRTFTPLSDIPDYLKKATIAVEDKDFYKHGGFDPLAVLRILKNVLVNRRLIGGSTLTQQLVKNALLTNERTITRKIKELVLAIEIERKFSKDEILQMYLNESPYGGTAWGIAAASETYFGKKPSELNLTEAVILAGMPQSPSRYSPYGKNPLAYVKRATDVARRMREDGYISKEEEKDVVDNLTNVGFTQKGNSIKAPHFVMYVKDLLEDMYGEDMVEQGGFRVITSLDYEVQEESEKIVGEEIDKVAGPMHITNGAAMALDANNGEILAMVGSRNFFDNEHDGQVNVVMSKRQPGSAIKPVTYAAAFAKGFWPGMAIADVGTEFPSGDSDEPYKPVNYDGKDHGLVNLRSALGSSLNVPAVKVLAMVGLKDMLKMAYDMGFESLEPTTANMRRLGLSVTLGGGEVRLHDLVTGYATFANGGVRVKPVAILKVIDKNGKTIYENKKVEGARVMDEKVAYLINSVLSDNSARLITFGENSLLNMQGRNVAVKTGTTNDKRDNWAIGWTRNTVVGVWVGNNDNSQMKQVASGVSGASPIWRRVMLKAVGKYKDPTFERPAGVEERELDVISGYPAHDGWPSRKDVVISGTIPPTEDPIHKYIEVCKSDNNKLATSVQIAQGDFDKKEVIVIKENDPLNETNKWQESIDAWVGTQSDSRYKVPSEFCGEVVGVHVEIRSPGDRVRIDSKEVNVEATVVSDKKIEWVDLYLDGNKELRWTERPYTKTFTLDKGIHTIRIVGRNEAGVESDRVHQFGVETDWVDPNTVTPTPTPTETPTVAP